MNFRGAVAAAFFLLLIAPASVQAASVPPAPAEDGVWVIDAANVLTDSEFESLNAVCNDLYLETGRPIVVLTIESFGGQGAYGWHEMDYANFAFDEYGIMDDAGQDKAILVFMSEGDRRFWTELGGGYDGENRDAYVQYVFDNDVKPLLGDDLWYEGLNAAVVGMEPILRGESFSWASWAISNAIPILIVSLSFVLVVRRYRIAKPAIKNWVEARSGALTDLVTINRVIVANIVDSEGNRMSQDEMKILSEWDGKFSHPMDDDLIGAFRELDSTLQGSSFEMSLEKYQVEMENVRTANELEEVYNEKTFSLFSTILLPAVIISTLLMTLVVSRYNNMIFNIPMMAFAIEEYFEGIAVTICCVAPLLAIAAMKTIDPTGGAIGVVNVATNLDHQMGLVNGMPFFSASSMGVAGAVAYSSSDYHWTHSSHDDVFTDSAGHTSSERAAMSSSSSGGGGGGGF